MTNEQIAREIVSIMSACSHADKRCQYWGMSACGECTFTAYSLYKKLRKAQLAEYPRCEVPGCNRRGTLTVAYTTLMCKKHYDKASSELMRRCAGLWMGVVVPNKTELIDLATA